MTGAVLNFVSLAAAVILVILFYRRHKEKQIEALNAQLVREIENAYVDPVTGRENFAKFKLQAREILDAAPHSDFAIFYSDIRNFKYVNDVYGFEAGNRLLKYYSDWLAAQNKLAFARVSADNFVSLEACRGEADAVAVCEARLRSMDEMRDAIEGLGAVTVFVGIYCTGGNNDLSIDAMIDRAMIAQRQLKQTQASGCLLYREKFRQNMIINQRLENRMEAALKNGEFELYLQPKINICGQSLVSCEALVRWLAPEAGVIPPGEFIPLFERNGFIRQFDLYMFRKVCALLRSWLDGAGPLSGAAAADSASPAAKPAFVPVSVNVSKVLLSSPTFLQDYLAVKQEFDIPGGLLEIEFTESMLFDNSSRMQTVLAFFREHGIKCAIDDFGSGYSSLNLLKVLPADILKLDKLFFSDDGNPGREQIILKSVISMANDLSMQVVAEGVEHMEQVDFLRSINCLIVQGYVFDRPLPVKAFERKYLAREE